MVYLFFDCCGLGGLFDNSGKQYPHKGGRTERLTILPRTCMTFTATPSVEKNIYVNLVDRKAKLEEKLKEISLAMSVMLVA
ncbi:hypothetical protein P8452_51251 [Trifolium repens]|nr:hypothetical protein P8452_51251 [Trifolium repens]